LILWTTIERILEHYGITGLKRNNDELRGRCPIHEQGKGERSFTVNITKNVFQCFHCKVKGNVIDFVAKKEGCNIREAGLKIWQWFELGQQTTSPPAQDAPLGPSAEPTPAEHDMQAQKKVVFRCPHKCGGRIRNKVRFYLTSEPAFAVSGECDRCGEYGFVEISLNDLFKEAPIKTTVQ
jgi:hypothetical protein